MSPSGSSVPAYLERGAKRVFAGAIEWPGWCRSGRDEAAALKALVAYGPRYAAALRSARLGFHAPKDVSALRPVERLDGDATTDFGAPSIAPAADERPVDAAELRRLRRILEASWSALDRAAEAAEGVELRTGPRGGGRDLDAIGAHVTAAEAGYVRRLAGPTPPVDDADPRGSAAAVRAAALEALTHAVTEGLPAAGPRGGKIWLPRYFVRRAAWHVLDHAWEIEDRARR